MFRSSRRWFIALVMIGLLVPTLVGPAQAAQPGQDYAALDREIRQMHEDGLFAGGKGYDGPGKGDPAVFDAAGARKRNYSAKSIAIAEQLVALSNELTSSLSDGSPGIGGGKGAAASAAFASLVPYFAATAAGAAGAAEEEPGPVTQGIFGRVICGWYTNPKPRVAADWQRRSSRNAAETLRALGYHPTPNLVGGGWTRPHTWKWWVCGWNTYRDHAYTTSSTTFYEQYYGGFSPNGEPNPEVYRSGPWPYADWPAYVYWWHTYGPGR